ncbi:MAG: GntR family transcriptional regulator [Ruminococcaceae bacterium]|nr:GntR family transcriptional regulator [Oscillospiraceae bacterium]
MSANALVFHMYASVFYRYTSIIHSKNGNARCIVEQSYNLVFVIFAVNRQTPCNLPLNNAKMGKTKRGAAMGSVQLNLISAVDAVCTALEADILNLRFAPGEKITESELSERYSVSRNTIREAVAHLLAQGLLTKIANKGVYVRKFTAADVQEIFHLRALLELEAIRSIAAANTVPAGLFPLVQELESYDRVDRWDDYVRLDILFHTALVAAANSSRLSRLYDTILTEVKLCIYQTRNYVTIPAGNDASHRQILDALYSREYDTAMQLLVQHIQQVITRYCTGLEAMEQNKNKSTR